MAASFNSRPAIARSDVLLFVGSAFCFGILYLWAGIAVQAQDTTEADGIIGPAVDWSLESQVSLGLDADINRQLEAGNQDTGLIVDIDGGFVLQATAKRSEISADFGVSRTFFVGDEDTGDAQRLDPRFAISGSYRGKTYTLSGQAGFDFRPTSFTQDEDTGLTNDETTQLTVNYETDLMLQLDRLNQLTISSNVEVIDFTDPAPGLVATRTFGGELEWQHQLTETTELTITGGGRYFTAQNPEDTQSQTFDFSLGLSHQRTSRHTFGVNAGLTAVRTEERNAVGFRESDFTVGFTGGASLDYSLKSLTIAVDLTQSIDPSATGALQSFSRIGGTLNYDINDQESLGISANYFLRSPLSNGDGATLQSFNIGPTYTLDLTDDAQLATGYLFRLNDDSVTGNAIGHRVFLTLSHDFELVP